jgi:hypothetical protein
MTDSGHKPAAATDDELRRTVAMLLSTQQTLIDLRHRRDRELRVLDVIVRFSERVLPDQAGTPFWDSVADAATETFECEICIVAALRGREPRRWRPADHGCVGRKKSPNCASSSSAGWRTAGPSWMAIPRHKPAWAARRWRWP